MFGRRKAGDIYHGGRKAPTGFAILIADCRLKLCDASASLLCFNQKSKIGNQHLLSPSPIGRGLG
jgi:hypothetical protein